MKKKIIAITLTFVTALSLLMATSCSIPKVNQLFCKHEFETEIVKNATCTESGEKKYTCTLCEYEKIEKIKALDHVIVEDEAVSPSCIENGKTLGQRCAVCGLILKEQQIIPAPGHTLETIPGRSATCSETGLTEGAYCTVCNKTVIAQQEVEKLPHNAENGLCKDCGRESYDFIERNEFTEVPLDIGDTVVNKWIRFYNATDGDAPGDFGITVNGHESTRNDLTIYGYNGSLGVLFFAPMVTFNTDNIITKKGEDYCDVFIKANVELRKNVESVDVYVKFTEDTVVSGIGKYAHCYFLSSAT